eukprot:g13944.t1.1.5e17418c g13944  g13944.t1 contig9:789813-792639(-)
MTPQSSLSDWGVGVGMYFSTLISMAFIFILAGLINVANIMYYSSDEYDPGEGRNNFFLLNMLQFSAICTEREWVVCDKGCKENIGAWNSIFTNSYYGKTTDPVTGEEVTVINQTTCLPAQFDQGMWNFGTLLLLILCMSIFYWYLSKLEVRYDEDNSAAPDYTLIVRNPPPTALDPEEWRDFFDQYSDKQVTLCTIALNNERLLSKLVQRRQIIKTLRGLLPVGTNFDDDTAVITAVAGVKRKRENAPTTCIEKIWDCTLHPLLRLLGYEKTETEIYESLKATTEEIKSLQQVEYQAAAVFMTFETEQGQRTALEALNASSLEVLLNKNINLDPSSMFRDTVLHVEEASEPTAVRWMDLNYNIFQINARILITFGITLGLVVLSAWILDLSRTRVNVVLFSIILSTFNVAIPMVVRILVAYEKHYDEGSSQASLYVKITFFRWVNTAIITRFITPFLSTLGEESIDMINTINALLLSEMVVSPLLRYFDIFEIMSRHYYAPRAKTQEEMFSCFSGGWYNLAERFTDFTKILLVAIFYSPFYPLIYFLSATILFIQYWVDKFLLLRSWQKAPFIGTETARFSRVYFTTAAVVLGAISSAFAYAQSPFTFLCSCDENSDSVCNVPNTQSFANVELLNGTQIGTIETSGVSYYFCDQRNIGFPPTPDKQGDDVWMTPSQERLSRLYGWFCLILLVLYGVGVLGQQFIRRLLSLTRGVYKPTGADQHKDFSSGIGIESFGYIPQLTISGFHFPLLCCNIDDIDMGLISWRNPNAHNKQHPSRNYDEYNLIFDVPFKDLTRSRHETVIESNSSAGNGKPLFSIVKHWPPDWAKAKDAITS